MINNQLKKYKKNGFLARRNNTFEKQIGSQPGFVRSPGSRVNLAGQPSFVGFLLISSFVLPISVQLSS
jgi:hypothetical protein